MLGANWLNVLASASSWGPSTIFRFGFNLKTVARVEAAASILPYKNPNLSTQPTF